MAKARPSQDLVACVVAWHNAYPLARRITAAQVVSVGLVSFPFQVPSSRPGPQAATRLVTPESAPLGAGDEAVVPAAGGSLRERASARAKAAAAAQGAAAVPAADARPGAGATPVQRRKGWCAAFTENLLDPISPRQVSHWVLRHGSEPRPGSPEAPVREIDATGAGPWSRLWVFTAAVDCGAQRVRVLVAPFDARRVIGPRIIGRGRVQAASAGIAALGAGAAAWVLALGGVVQRPPTPDHAPAALASAPAGHTAHAASAEPGTPPASAAPAAAAAQATAVAAASPSSAPSSGSPAASHPAGEHPPALSEPTASRAAVADARPSPTSAAPTPDAAHGHDATTAPGQSPVRESPPDATLPATGRLRLAPFLSEEARLAAREASEAARAERAQRQPGHGEPATTAAHSSGAAPPASAAQRHAASPAPAAARVATASTPPPATAWAVSTRRLRTRFESEQMLAALRDVAYRDGRGSEFKLEVLPAGEDWQAVGWPLATRAEAERLRDALAARGLKADVVQF